MGFALSEHFLSLKPLAQRSLAFGSVGASYARVGGLFGEGIVNVIIQSFYNQPVQISFDGVTDHMPFPANGHLIFDVKSNVVALGGHLGIYVKQLSGSSLPTSGSIYVSPFGVD